MERTDGPQEGRSGGTARRWSRWPYRPLGLLAIVSVVFVVELALDHHGPEGPLEGFAGVVVELESVTRRSRQGNWEWRASVKTGGDRCPAVEFPAAFTSDLELLAGESVEFVVERSETKEPAGERACFGWGLHAPSGELAITIEQVAGLLRQADSSRHSATTMLTILFILFEAWVARGRSRRKLAKQMFD